MINDKLFSRWKNAITFEFQSRIKAIIWEKVKRCCEFVMDRGWSSSIDRCDHMRGNCELLKYMNLMGAHPVNDVLNY